MQNVVTCTIRVDEDAWEKLRLIADKSKRSMNKEIEYLIDKRIEEFEKEYPEFFKDFKKISV